MLFRTKFFDSLFCFEKACEQIQRQRNHRERSYVRTARRSTSKRLTLESRSAPLDVAHALKNSSPPDRGDFIFFDKIHPSLSALSIRIACKGCKRKTKQVRWKEGPKFIYFKVVPPLPDRHLWDWNESTIMRNISKWYREKKRKIWISVQGLIVLCFSVWKKWIFKNLFI